MPGMEAKASVRSSFIVDNTRVQEALRWRQVNMSVKVKGKNETKDKILLNNVWGEALPNETTALMGPSGAGKTSVLNALAGRAVTSGRVQVSADVRYGYAKIEQLPGGIQKFRQRIAFVPQDDIVNPFSTPREAIRFSAKLRLPRSTTNKEIESLVDEYIDKLGLTTCADNIIGGGLKKGISGGQKKRTCIGIDLVTDPGIVFLDEPTTGLDSVSAKDLMGLLNELARAGNVVIFTIHQPSSSIFMTFDKLILLAEGRVMYQGPTVDVPSYFEKAGYPLPQLENPADWVLTVAQGHTYDELRNGGFFFPEDHRIFEEERQPLRMSYYSPSTDNKTVPWWIQSSWLVEREFLSVKRNPGPLLVYIVSHAILGTIAGISFRNIGAFFNPDDISIVWALMVSISVAYAITMWANAALRLATLASQRHLFLKEYFCGTFTISSYLTSNITAELITTVLSELVFCIVTYFLLGLKYGFGWFYLVTILVAVNSSSSAFLVGSFFSNSQTASAFILLIVQPQLNFTGMWASIYYIPLFIRWLHYILYMYYSTAVTILLFCSDGIKDGSKGCTEILRQEDIDPKHEGLYWLGLIGILICTRLLGVTVFSLRARNFS